jgi:hypothetical protein
MSNPYRESPRRRMPPRGKREEPLVLPVGASVAPMCVKCGAKKHLAFRAESLRHTSSDQWAVAILTALVGFAYRQWHTVKLSVPLCGDCESAWDHAKSVERRTTFGIAGVLLLSIVCEIACAGQGKGVLLFFLGVMLATILAWLPIAMVVQRTFVRPRTVWVVSVDANAITLGGVCRKARRATKSTRDEKETAGDDGDIPVAIESPPRTTTP